MMCVKERSRRKRDRRWIIREVNYSDENSEPSTNPNSTHSAKRVVVAELKWLSPRSLLDTRVGR